MLDPIVIDPPGFDQAKMWKECSDAVDQCGGLTHDDGEVNWRAAFSADPGCCSCPSCWEYYWAWGNVQQCVKCGFKYETNAWAMYSWGVQAKNSGRFTARDQDLHKASKYFRYGFEHPIREGIREEFERIKWPEVFPEDLI